MGAFLYEHGIPESGVCWDIDVCAGVGEVFLRDWCAAVSDAYALPAGEEGGDAAVLQGGVVVLPGAAAVCLLLCHGVAEGEAAALLNGGEIPRRAPLPLLRRLWCGLPDSGEQGRA